MDERGHEQEATPVKTTQTPGRTAPGCTATPGWGTAPPCPDRVLPPSAPVRQGHSPGCSEGIRRKPDAFLEKP